MIRELLWDWFVDIRRSLATRISPKFVLMKAKAIAKEVLSQQRAAGKFEAFPVLDRGWLSRFKKDKGIVWRRPNMRFKCSRVVLLGRLRAMWLNCIRVRRLAEHTLGHDLSEAMYGIDEKPLHFNEAGSKCIRTLEIAGAPAVRLKENHAATRERCSLMTMVTSDRRAASSPANIPIELMFKAKSSRRIRALQPPDDLRFSLAWAEKGSYRQPHILEFLNRWLPPWTPERAAAADYRVLFLDVAGSHVSAEVTDFAWTRGYVVLFHYGCTTGVGQVNDTDCHGAFEAAYLELEQAAFNHQQLYEPGSVARRPQDVIDDVAATWRSLPHLQGVEGHYRNALAVTLDGSEDHRIRREALAFWREGDLPSLRRTAVAEVDAQIASGALRTFADWRTLIEHPENPGVLEEEGQEFEGDVEPAEQLWHEEGDEEALEEAELLDEEFELEESAALVAAEASAAAASASMQVEVLPLDQPEDIEEAIVVTRRLGSLKKLRADALAQKVPAAFYALDKEISQLERGLRAKDKADRKANVVLRRALDKAQAEEAAKLQALRLEALKARMAAASAKAKAAEDRRLAEEKKAAATEIQKKLEALPKEFNMASCTGTSAKAVKMRADLLERLKLSSPPLSFEENGRWPLVRDRCATQYGIKYGALTGERILRDVRDVIGRLGSHHRKPEGHAKDAGGDPAAFLDFSACWQSGPGRPLLAAPSNCDGRLLA